MKSDRRFLSVAVLALVLGACPVAGAVAQAARGSNDGQNRRVRIHNQTGWVLTGLQLTDVRRADWRGAALGRDAVATGESVIVNVDDGLGACVYGLRAEFSNGQTLERTNVNACQIADYYFTR